MNIYFVFLIVLCNMLSYRASKVLLSLFAVELGVPQFYIGTLIAMYALLPLLLALYAGKLSDRLGVRSPILYGSAGLTCGMVLPFLFPGLPALYASAMMIGASHIFYSVATQNLLGIVSNEETRTRNVSNYALIISVAAMLGPLMAGFSIDHFGHVSSYLYFAAVPLLSVLTMVLFARGLVSKQRAGKSGTEERALDGKSLLANAPLRRILITAGIVVTGHDLFQFYMPIYGRSIGLSASAIGIVIGCLGAASFVARLVLPALAKRWGEKTLFIYSISLGAIAYLLFPLFESAVLLGVFAFVLGLGMGCCQTLALILIYHRAPQERTGEALGLRFTINNFMHISVPLACGALGSVLGVGPVFVANSLLLAGGAMMMKTRDRT